MPITPAAGYMIDPNNPNGVVPIGSVSMPGSVASYSSPTPSISYGAVNNTPSTPVSVLSSSTGQNILNQNTQSLQKIESNYTGPSIVDYLGSAGQDSSYAARAKLAAGAGITDYTGSSSQNTQLLQALRNISGSPASGAMISDINKAVSSGGMTASETKGLNDLKASEDAVTMAAAKARAALDAKDYRGMDYWTAKAEANRKTYEKQLSDYYEATKELRTNLTKSLTPGAKEVELTQKLNDIRTQAEKFKLQTEKDKLTEYSGQNLGFANARAGQLDKNASFKLQEMALDEKNLLLSLGLEQDARKYAGEVAKTGLTYLADDFELQQKVQDKLDQQENDLFNKANTLADDSKSALISILDNLNGVNPKNMDANSIKQLEDMSARANIPFNIVQQALTAQYNKFVFDQAKANKPTESEKDSAAVTAAKNQLTSAVGSDGYTDPNLYARLRSASNLSPTEFDNRFGYLVNPQSRARLGLTSSTVGQEGAIAPADYTKGLNYLLNNGATASDIESFKSDRKFQAWVLSKIAQ